MFDMSSEGSNHRRRGAALFIVLMLAALLSGLASVAMRSSMSGARAAVLFADVMQADELGRATAEAVAHYVATGGSERRRGGAFTIRLPKADIAVDYVSESARIDANDAPLELIAALLTVVGAEPAQVASILKRITIFRAQKRVPESPAPPAASTGRDGSVTPGTSVALVPEAEDAAQTPPSGAGTPLIQHANEIAGAWGLPAGLANLVLPALTVTSGSAKVDPVLADRLVIAALLGGDPDRVDDYLQRRSQGFASADSALALIPSQGRAFASFSDVSVLRALARVTVAGRFERRYEVVLQPADHPGQVPKTLSWQPLI